MIKPLSIFLEETLTNKTKKSLKAVHIFQRYPLNGREEGNSMKLKVI